MHLHGFIRLPAVYIHDSLLEFDSHDRNEMLLYA